VTKIFLKILTIFIAVGAIGGAEVMEMTPSFISQAAGFLVPQIWSRLNLATICNRFSHAVDKLGIRDLLSWIPTGGKTGDN